MTNIKSLNTKKILILGGSHRDIPLIKAAQELGYYVATLGDRKYYLGHNYADNFYNVNFNDISKVKKILKDDNFDFLVPGSGEESYLKTVQISQELNIGNFDDFEIAKLVHNKWEFKEFCIKNAISVPKGFFYKEDNNLDLLTFPIVVKPTNLSGGRGVEIVYNEEELENHINNLDTISKDDLFLEEYIEGDLIAYSIFIKNQKIVYDFIAKDDVYLNKYLITTAYPTEIKRTIHKRLKIEIEKLSSLLKLVDGMFHLQVLLKKDVPYIIDVTRRIPGDFFPDMMELCDEVSYNKAVIQAYTTGKVDNWFHNKIGKQNFVIRHCIMPVNNGIYKEIIIDESLKPYIKSIFELEKKGLIVKNYLHTQIAIILISLPEKDHNIVNNINNLIYANIQLDIEYD
jgi:biotin carboxylase